MVDNHPDNDITNYWKIVPLGSISRLFAHVLRKLINKLPFKLLIIDLFTVMVAILNSIVSNSYYGMLRGQIHTNLPPEHPIIDIWNNRIQNGFRISEKVCCYTWLDTIYWKIKFLNYTGDQFFLAVVFCWPRGWEHTRNYWKQIWEGDHKIGSELQSAKVTMCII